MKKENIQIIFFDDVTDRDDSNKNYLYPVFSKCIPYTSDPFWIGLLEDLSNGKCPKSIYISNSTIYCTGKKNGFSFFIPKEVNDYKEFFIHLKESLSENTSICSSIDIDIKKKKIKESKREVTNTSLWSDIKKKNTKDMYILEYVIRMKKKYNTEWCIARQLYSLVQIAFIYKTHSSKDIVFNNKKIEKIHGIEFDGKKFINIRPISDSILTEDVEEQKYLYHYWNKYISSVVRSMS